MAEKRMFAKSIVLSDAFLDMPMSARCLYFTLGMLADDDGFVGNPKSIMRQCGASKDDIEILITKRYLLAFESGVIVIKHWRINNYLRTDRYASTTYLEEKSHLIIDDNGAYTDHEKCLGIPSIDKNSIDKNRLDKNICTTNKFVKPTLEQVKEYCKERNNNVDPEKFIDFYTSKGWKVGNQPMKDWKACVRTWERKDKKEDSLPNYDDSCNKYLSPEELEKSLARRNRDTLPIYDPSKNKNLSNEEIEELLANRGK